MGIRHWLREQLLEGDAEGDDVPPSASLVNSALGRERIQPRTMGEYDAATFPEELAEVIRRREQVAAELLRIDITDPRARIAAVPDLQRLLRIYPHPLAYELLILAYVDTGRFDEAKGVAFAARERRLACARSEHQEIRAETDRLREWTPQEIDELRAEREARTR